MVWTLYAADAIRSSGRFPEPVVEDALRPPEAADSDGPVEGGNPYEVLARFDVFGRTDFITFVPEEPQHIWHSDALPVSPRPSAPVVATAPTQRVPLLPLLMGLAFGMLCAAAWLVPAHRRGMLAGACAALAIAAAGRDALPVSVPSFRGAEAQVPAEAQAQAIFASLHSNIYRAFDYQSEEAIYETLAQSVQGSLLPEIYRKIYRSLILQEEGGAICKVQKVQILGSEVLGPESEARRDAATFRVACRWRVHGIVEHWGHVHRRVNQYAAVYTLAPSEGAWKFSDVRITALERVNRAPG